MLDSPWLLAIFSAVLALIVNIVFMFFKDWWYAEKEKKQETRIRVPKLSDAILGFAGLCLTMLCIYYLIKGFISIAISIQF